MAKKFENPIVEYYKGRPVRKYNLIQIRVSAQEFKRFVDAKIDYGKSTRELLEEGNIPCHPCKTNITPCKKH